MREYIIAFECPVTESSERIVYQVQQKFVGELIRCKHCVAWNEEEQHGCTHDMGANDFCSRAERKEE